MIDKVITFATGIIISLISKTGYLGIFGLMTAESALIPIPSEITMPFSGYLAYRGDLNLVYVILVGTLANLFGSILAYWFGYWGQEHIVRQTVRKYGKYLLISEDELDKSEEWFRKYGETIIFFSRVLPIVRTFISLPAGMAEMNFWKFTTLTFFGCLIWTALLAYVGYFFGQNWNIIHPYYQKFEYLIVGLILIAGVYFIYHKLAKLKKKK